MRRVPVNIARIPMTRIQHSHRERIDFRLLNNKCCFHVIVVDWAIRLKSRSVYDEVKLIDWLYVWLTHCSLGTVCFTVLCCSTCFAIDLNRSMLYCCLMVWIIRSYWYMFVKATIVTSSYDPEGRNATAKRFTLFSSYPVVFSIQLFLSLWHTEVRRVKVEHSFWKS